MILVERLTRRYGPTLAVDNLSLQVDRGEIVGFLGPNGAGKSTTMRIITGYLAADEGRVEVAGIDVLKNPVKARERVGYLPESNPLYTDMTVEQFLLFVTKVRGVDRSKRRASVDRAVQAAGLKTVLRKGIVELSKGFRQRVGLAQALVHDPDLLILDEPTAGLDPNQVLEIRDLLLRLGSEKKTVMLSTHILQEVPAVCSRVLIVAKGRLVANGRLSELLRKEGIIKVMVSGIDVTKAEAALTSIQNVTIRSKTSIGSQHRFEVMADSADSVCESIVTVLSSQGGRISELHRQQETLEDCFRRFTRGTEPKAIGGAA